MTPLGFTRALGLAVVASMALVVAQLVAGPWIGVSAATSLALAALAVGYAALLAESPRRRVGNAIAALAGALLVLSLARTGSEVALGLAVVVGLVRGTGDRRRSSSRALAIELGLGVGGLSLARWLALPGVLGTGAAFWGYALFQCLYPLVQRASSRPTRRGEGDPFDRARVRLERLLEQGEV